MTGSGKWRCTDIGTRVIVAVCLDDHPDDPSWYNGPPYAVSEHCFDEYDQQGCTPFPPPGPAKIAARSDADFDTRNPLFLQG